MTPSNSLPSSSSSSSSSSTSSILSSSSSQASPAPSVGVLGTLYDYSIGPVVNLVSWILPGKASSPVVSSEVTPAPAIEPERPQQEIAGEPKKEEAAVAAPKEEVAAVESKTEAVVLQSEAPATPTSSTRKLLKNLTFEKLTIEIPEPTVAEASSPRPGTPPARTFTESKKEDPEKQGSKSAKEYFSTKPADGKFVPVRHHRRNPRASLYRRPTYSEVVQGQDPKSAYEIQRPSSRP